MADPLSQLRRFFRELKRRNVYQVALTYGVVGFVVIQVADVTFPHLRLPPWTVTLVIALVALGFPLSLVLAWAFELTPEGVRRPPRSGHLPRMCEGSSRPHLRVACPEPVAGRQ